MLGKLQKKNQELQRHLEKACRQLQHCVQEHKSAMQKLKGNRTGAVTDVGACAPLLTVTLVVTDEHESSSQMTREQHLQQLAEAKRATQTAESVPTRPT